MHWSVQVISGDKVDKTWNEGIIEVDREKVKREHEY